MNGHVKMLKDSNVDVEISGKIINCLLFADDVALFANSPRELHELNIPKSALLLELAWESVSPFIERRRLSYFKRLVELPDDRLCKQVFTEMVRTGEHMWSYQSEINNIIENISQGNTFCTRLSQINTNTLHGDDTRRRLLEDVSSKSSLDFYQQCYVGTGRQNYLNDNNNFRASRLKLLARTKTIPLNKYLNRMNIIDDDRCLLCTTDVSEDLEHFLLECISLSNVRNEFFELFQSVSSYYSINFIELSPSAKLQFLIGDVAYLFDDRLGCFYDTHGRFYVEKCFKARCEIMD